MRLGLTQFLEFDLITAGLLADRTTLNGSGRTLSHDVGTGAVTLQARYNLFGDDGGTYALALAPFVAIPSGDRHFGNQRIDGGIIAPLNINLPSDFQLVLETEVQAMRNGTGPAFASFTDIAAPVLKPRQPSRCRQPVQPRHPALRHRPRHRRPAAETQRDGV